MYIIVEMQTNGETTAVLTKTAEDENHAKSIYHQVLAAAAISQVELHAAALLTDYGYVLEREAFEHKQDTEGAGVDG